MEHLGESARMGPILRAEVEKQLLADLAHYGMSGSDSTIDWSEACGEGHCTRYLDGNLEELSGLAVVTSGGEPVAEGWFDFVHGGDGFPLFVFWLFLSVRVNGEWKKSKAEPVIPAHIWDCLPDESREACCKEGVYDVRWSKDPTVVAWKRRLTKRCTCPGRHSGFARHHAVAGGPAGERSRSAAAGARENARSRGGRRGCRHLQPAEGDR